jgi:hypothetical protein
VDVLGGAAGLITAIAATLSATASTISASSQSAGAGLTAGGSASGCLVRRPPGGLGGRLVTGVPADHRENGLGVRVVQSRHGLEGIIRLLEPADPPELGQQARRTKP